MMLWEGKIWCNLFEYCSRFFFFKCAPLRSIFRVLHQWPQKAGSFCVTCISSVSTMYFYSESVYLTHIELCRIIMQCLVHTLVSSVGNIVEMLIYFPGTKVNKIRENGFHIVSPRCEFMYLHALL